VLGLRRIALGTGGIALGHRGVVRSGRALELGQRGGELPPGGVALGRAMRQETPQGGDLPRPEPQWVVVRRHGAGDVSH